MRNRYLRLNREKGTQLGEMTDRSIWTLHIIDLLTIIIIQCVYKYAKYSTKYGINAGHMALHNAPSAH